MAYHRGGHAGAVAVSYSTNAMPTPLSPNRRYSSGNTGGTTTSGVGSSLTKSTSYRSSVSTSFDRPSSYYSSSSSSSTSGYSSSHRSSYSNDYRRYCSPARSLSVSSSSFSDAGTASTAGSGISGSNSSNRYSSSLSRDRSETRDTFSNSAAISTADLFAKYSPANYVPNISGSNERNSAAAAAAASSAATKTSAINGYGNSTLNTKSNNLTSSSIFGGNASNAKSSSPSSSSSLLTATKELSPSVLQGRPPRAARRSPLNTVINNHAQPDNNAAAASEVNGDQIENYEDSDNNNNENSAKFHRNYDDNDHDEESINDRINRVSTNFYYSNPNSISFYSTDANATAGTIEHRSDIPKNFNTLKTNKSLDINTNSTTTTSSSTTAAAGLSIAGDKGVIGVINSADCGDFLTANNSDLLSLTNTEILTNNNIDADEEEEKANSGKKLNERIGGTDFSCSLNFFNEADNADDADESLKFDRNKSDILSKDNNLLDINNSDEVNDSTVFRKNVVSKPNGNQAGDNTNLPSTSRRGDSYSGNGSNSNASNGVGNTSQTATAHQNIYRGINEQIEGSPTIRAPRNRLQTPRDERCGLNGLRNIGNTCFMNSVIQCLSNTKPLLEYLVNEQYLADINTATSSMKGALIKAFSQVIQELWEVGGEDVVNTASLKSQIQRFAPRFMGYSQQDAQEFLRYLLEGLHEDVNRVTVKPQPIHTDIPEHYTDSQKAAESWKRYLRNEDSTIVDVFVGQLRSSLHCTSCGHVSVTLDPFWDLSLPIPTRSGTVKLNQCLEHFTKEEVLDGDEKPTCSKCQMRRKCTKRFSIQKFPKILVIHLKRFSPMERFRGKLNTLVDFPLTGLDLGAFSAPRVAGCTYNLYGVANHSGTTYSGHYTAYCKHPYSGEWHEYNDSRVSSIASRSVVSSEGYVLFYEQQPHSSNL